MLYIKNMVCDRCKAAVVNELENAGIDFQKVEVGEVTLNESPTAQQLESFKSAIHQIGFEWMDDKKSKLIADALQTDCHGAGHEHQRFYDDGWKSSF